MRMNKYKLLGYLIKAVTILFPLLTFVLVMYSFNQYALWLVTTPLSKLWIILTHKTLMEILVAVSLVLALPASLIFLVSWYTLVIDAWMDE